MQINKEIIDSLILFEEKIEEIKSSKFFHFYFEEVKEINYNISWKKIPGVGVLRHSFPEPPEESIKAYLLPFRFFIQESERCSIKNLGIKIIPKIENDFSEQTTEIKQIREAINSFLDSPPGIKLKFQWGSEQLEFKSNRDINICFIYGHYAHAEEKNNQKRWYDLIHTNSDEGKDLFRFEVISIILQLTSFFLAISKSIRIILDKIIDYDLEEGKKAINENDLEKGVKFYKNVLYITEKLNKPDILSETLKKISELYSSIGNTRQSEAYLGEYKEILFSVRHFPEKFKDNVYYAEYFSLSDEYREIIEKILQKS